MANEKFNLHVKNTACRKLKIEIDGPREITKVDNIEIRDVYDNLTRANVEDLLVLIGREECCRFFGLVEAE